MTKWPHVTSFTHFFNRKCSCALMDDWMMTWYSTLCNSTYLSRSSIFIVNIFQYFEFDIIWHKPISLLRLIPTTMSPQRWPLDRNAETYVLTFILTSNLAFILTNFWHISSQQEPGGAHRAVKRTPVEETSGEQAENIWGVWNSPSDKTW